MVEEKDLVVLMYAPNVCYTNVVDFGTEGTESIGVDVEDGVWHYKTGAGPLNHYTLPIGRARPSDQHGSRGGVIGVYDRTDIEHLASMVHDSREATKSRSVISD